MVTFDIYSGYNGEETTGRYAEYAYLGINPADTIAKFVADYELMRSIRVTTKGEMTEMATFDDEMSDRLLARRWQARASTLPRRCRRSGNASRHGAY